MQSVSRLTPVCDAASGEMALVVDFEAKLRHTRDHTMRQLETLWERKSWSKRSSQCGYFVQALTK